MITNATLRRDPRVKYCRLAKAKRKQVPAWLLAVAGWTAFIGYVMVRYSFG